MYGYRGKILRANLSDRTFQVEPLDLKRAKKFIGGRGFAAHLLLEEIDPSIDALSTENKLIISTGPLTGTPTPTGGRYMVTTKSPLSDIATSSNSGGHWGAELKFAGYDAIIIEGKSETPVYISIEDDKLEYRDASHLWGRMVSETTNTIKNESADKSRTLTIGPAGENLSRIAAIMNDYDRAAGRSGVGAVMGSKNLKAISVRGTTQPELYDRNGLKDAVSAINKTIRENDTTGTGLPTFGTAVLVNIMNENGVFPTRNYQTSVFEESNNISGETLAEKYLVKKEACFRCPIACGRYCKTDEVEGGGPEFETIWAYGAACGIDDLEEIIKTNHWCNEVGVDTISAGTTVAAAMELYQKGYIKDDDLDGIPLAFGDAGGIVEWTKRMGSREGLGDLLAEGSYRLCDHYGVPELSMSSKKLELPAYDPRGIQGQGLAYATCNRGGCHVRGYVVSPEVLGNPEKIDRFATEGKASWAKFFQDQVAIIDSLGLCVFTSFAIGAEEYCQMYNAACGTDHTVESLREVGERIWCVEKIFNLRAGLTMADDTLPKRLLEEKIPEGPSAGHVHRLAEMLPEYYRLRGWDERGIPSDERLKKLLLTEEFSQ